MGLVWQDFTMPHWKVLTSPEDWNPKQSIGKIDRCTKVGPAVIVLCFNGHQWWYIYGKCDGLLPFWWYLSKIKGQTIKWILLSKLLKLDSIWYILFY